MPNQVNSRLQDYQSHVQIWWRFMRVVTGNNIAIFTRSTMLWNHYAMQNTAAINDELFCSLWLKAGTYRVNIEWLRQTTNGILSLSVATEPNVGNEIYWSKTLDMYGVTGDNQNTLYTDLTIPRDSVYGQHLKAKVASKNAASSGYYCPICVIDICRDTALV